VQRVLPGLLPPFEKARQMCSDRLGATGIDVHVLDAPDECIPEWGIGGFTYGPHTIVLAVDPDHDIDATTIFSTLVHEMHHAIRWRGPGCGTTLGERLVSEGLAQVFESECTGRVPRYAQGEIRQEHRALALAAIREDPADDGRWFFGAADVPRWFGYRLGYSIVEERTNACGRDAAEMVHEPAAVFLSTLER
jgi:uncharacterized protein YjaZ